MKTKTFEENVKELKGDGLRVNMDFNDLNLRVRGDGCRVTVARNSGKIRVVGDGCSLKVNCNDGKIEYKGDGGRILLGTGSGIESVSYVGDGGRISVKSARNEKGDKIKSEKVGLGTDFKKSGCSLSDSELEIKLDNEANERKEAKGMKKNFVKNHASEDLLEKRKDTTLRRSKTIVVTRISSQLHTPVNVCNNSLIKNWFRSPPSVIRSFKSSSAESL